MDHPIRTYRKNLGLTLEQFGRLVGVQKAAVSKWERGVKPSPVSAIKIDAETGGDITKEQLRPDFWPSASGQAQ